MRRTPFGPPPLDRYPSVRFAVRAWAIYQCVSAVVAGIVLLAFLLIGFRACEQMAQRPSGPAALNVPPTWRMTREQWFRHPPEAKVWPGDDAETRWFKSIPPPEGYAYNRNWHLVPDRR